MAEDKASILSDYSRFFRYVMPGIVFLLELFILRYLYNPNTIKNIVDVLKTKDSFESLAIVAAVIMSSGGIGFLLGTVYYTIFKRGLDFPMLRYFFYDNLSIVKSAISAGRVVVQERKACGNNEEPDPPIISGDKLTHAQAMCLVTFFAFGGGAKSKKFQKVSERLYHLTHVVHGAGTSFVGSIMVVLCFFLINYHNDSDFWRVSDAYIGVRWFVVIMVIMVGLHLYNYTRMVKYYEGIFSAAFWRELTENHSRNNPWIFDIVDTNIPKCKNR